MLGSDLRSPPPRKGEGGSGRSDMARIQDMFMRVIDETLAQARANPDEYMLTPEQIRLLAQDVLDGDSSLPPNHPIARETRQSIIRVVIEVLNNIYREEGPGKGQAPMDDDADVEMDDEEDDGMDDEDDNDGGDMDDEDDYDGCMDDDDGGGMGNYEDTESDEDHDLSSPHPQVISKGGPKIIG